jgi:hypothetical protein
MRFNMSPLDRLQTLESAAIVLRLRPSTLKRGLRQGRIRSHTLSLPANVAPFSGFPGGVLPVPYFVPREILSDLSAA